MDGSRWNYFEGYAGPETEGQTGLFSDVDAETYSQQQGGSLVVVNSLRDARYFVLDREDFAFRGYNGTNFYKDGSYDIRDPFLAIDRNGDFIFKPSELPPSAGYGHFVAIWIPKHTLTFNPNGGSVEQTSKICVESEAVGTLPDPTRDGYVFSGWFTSADGGTMVEPTTTYSWTENVEIYAHWEDPTSYRIDFDPNGGEVSPSYAFVRPGTSIGELPTPTRVAHDFSGWFTAAEGGTEITQSSVFDSDTRIYAHWTTDPDFVRGIELDANGGTVSPSSLSCLYGLPIGTMPIPVLEGKIFRGWFTSAEGGTQYSSVSTCDWSGTITLHAHWADSAFGNLTDWFGLETPDGPLMLVGSTDGATRSVTETSHSGALAIQTADSSVGAFERGGILMNPTCTYRIRKAGTVQIKAGKAYGSATITGNGTTSNPYRATKSGYMLVQAEYRTAADGEPVLIVRGAANEGYVWTNGRMVSQLTDAINQWTVNLSVDPDHIAQDPMNGVSGGGEMTECRTLITCDPVVPTEGGMPCASDVVHGKIVVTATTNAYLGESAPTAAGSFVEINGDPNSETDVDFTSYAFQAERSL